MPTSRPPLVSTEPAPAGSQPGGRLRRPSGARWSNWFHPGRTPEELARERRCCCPYDSECISCYFSELRHPSDIVGTWVGPGAQAAQAAFQLREQGERAEHRPGEVEVTALGQRRVQMLADLCRGGPEAGLGHVGDLDPVRAELETHDPVEAARVDEDVRPALARKVPLSALPASRSLPSPPYSESFPVPPERKSWPSPPQRGPFPASPGH